MANSVKKTVGLFLLFFGLSFSSYAQKEFWGTVGNAGLYGHGYLYKTDSTGENLVIVKHFKDSVNGKVPGGNLLMASNGKLYGLTNQGGQNNKGVLYEYDPDIDSLRVLFHFNPSNVAFPYTHPDAHYGLIEVFPGVLYGHLMFGGVQHGLVFKYTLGTNVMEVAVAIPSFLGGPLNTTQGNYLAGSMYKSSDGYLYATTHTNSQCPTANPYMGSIVRINPVNDSYSILYLSPCSTDQGYKFHSPFIEEGSDLYSVSRFGGTSDKGVIYGFNSSTMTYTKKYDFPGGADGGEPYPFIKADNGLYYSTTAVGGDPYSLYPNGSGILFEYDPATNVVVKKMNFVHLTTGNADVGPYGKLCFKATNGNLYGTTRFGIFEYNMVADTATPAARYPYPSITPYNPSLIEICRRPSYDFQETFTYNVCDGDPFSIDLACTNGDSFVWKQNGNTDISRTTPLLSFTTITPADAGTWICEMTNECGTTISQSLEITVNTTLPATVTVQDNILESTIADSYQWIDCDNGNSVLPGAINQVYTAGVIGHYAVITAVNGCQDTSACHAVLSFSGFDDPNVSNAIRFFPNPAHSNLTLVVPADAEIIRVSIMNASGDIVYKGTSAHVDLTTLSNGSYFLIVKTNQGDYNAKFVKE
jgi:hypothetical protein